LLIRFQKTKFPIKLLLNEFQALSLFAASPNKISALISAIIMMAYVPGSRVKNIKSLTMKESQA
jgi:hypothetical protein